MKHRREPQDEDEQQLLRDGWEFAGISLFSHPQIPRRCFTKEQALEQHMGFYCPACDSCGEAGCCPPETCKCLYGEHYKRSYRDLTDEWDQMFKFIENVSIAGHWLDKYQLTKRARQLINTLGGSH